MPGEGGGRDYEAGARRGGVARGGHLLGKGYVIAVRVRVIQIFAATDITYSQSAPTHASHTPPHLEVATLARTPLNNIKALINKPNKSANTL